MPSFDREASYHVRKSQPQSGCIAATSIESSITTNRSDPSESNLSCLCSDDHPSRVNFCVSASRSELVRTCESLSAASLMKPVRSRSCRRFRQILIRSSVYIAGSRLRSLADQVAVVLAQSSRKRLGPTNGEAVRGVEVQPAQRVRVPSTKRVASGAVGNG